MNKKIVIWSGVAVVLLTTLYLFLTRTENNSVNGELQSDIWENNYDFNEKNAQGIYYFNELIQKHTSKRSYNLAFDLDSILPKDSFSTLICVGKDIYLNEQDRTKLWQRIEQGSTVFLSFENISSTFFSYLFENEGQSWVFKDKISCTLNDKNFYLSSVYQADTLYSKWNIFKLNQLRQYHYEFDSVKTFSQLDNYINGLEIYIGKGKLMLHANPRLFQNYQVVSQNGLLHAKEVIKLIPKNKAVYWLEYAKISPEEIQNSGFDENEGNGESNKSALKYIFNDPNLRFALFLSLIGIILYLLFRTKRLLPIIPYFKKEQNQAVLFAETIADIYLKQKNHLAIVKQIRTNFFTTINKHFSISLEENTEEKIKKLSEKAAINSEEITPIIQSLNSSKELNNKELGELHHRIFQFYSKTGIISEKIIEKNTLAEIQIHFKLIFGLSSVILALLLFFSGLYGLHKAFSWSVILLPCAFFCLLLANYYFSLKISIGKQLTITNLFRKVHYPFEEIIEIYIQNEFLIIRKDTLKTQINLSNLEGQNFNQLKAFINKINRYDARRK